MKRYWIYRLMVGLMLSGSLLSCGDGGGGGLLAEGGIGGTGFSSGTITGFGSVFVNGVEFNTDDAIITVDGDLASESDLGIGMVVVVEADFDGNGLSGKAKRIMYEETVVGSVDTVNLVDESMVVLGQTVRTDQATVFDGVDFDDLDVGNIVEVSGFTSSSGIVQATRIEFKSDRFVANATELEVTGIVENLNEAAMTFRIGGLVIDYSSAVLTDLLDGGLSNGSLVEVESIEERVGGVLTASRVEGQEFDLTDFGGLRAELEGVVTEFVSPSEFDVNGIPVRTDENTSFENGTADDIAPDVKLEVEGTVDANGVLRADEIEFDLDATVEIDADVQAVDAQDSTLLLLGITVAVNQETVVRDASDAEVQPFGLEDIRIGDRVVVLGNPMGNVVTAVRLERTNPALEVELEGPVTANSNPTFEILGVTAVTTIDTEFKDSNDVPISAAEFFAGLQVGAIAEVAGTLSGANVIDAAEAELGD